MEAHPVIGANISQTLFKQNESVVVPSDSVSVSFQNLTALSGINSIPQELNNMQSQMPAYLQQAHLSTWYQDQPWETLTYSKKYGVPPMGGNLNLQQPPGYKPGNIFKSPIEIMKEGFENGPINIHWK